MERNDVFPSNWLRVNFLSKVQIWKKMLFLFFTFPFSLSFLSFFSSFLSLLSLLSSTPFFLSFLPFVLPSWQYSDIEQHSLPWNLRSSYLHLQRLWNSGVLHRVQHLRQASENSYLGTQTLRFSPPHRITSLRLLQTHHCNFILRQSQLQRTEDQKQHRSLTPPWGKTFSLPEVTPNYQLSATLAKLCFFRIHRGDEPDRWSNCMPRWKYRRSGTFPSCATTVHDNVTPLLSETFKLPGWWENKTFWRRNKRLTHSSSMVSLSWDLK